MDTLDQPRPRATRRFPLMAQIMAAFLAVVAILVSVGVVAIVRLSQQGEQDLALMTTIYDSELAVQELQDALWQVRSQGIAMRALTEEEIPDAWVELQARYVTFEDELAEFSALFESKFDTSLPNYVADYAVWEQYKQNQMSLYEPTFVGEPVPAEERTAVGNDLVARVNALATLIGESVQEDVQATESSTATVQQWLTVVMVIAVIVAVGLGIFVSRKIVRSAGVIKASLERLAEGDLTAEARVRSNDEMGDMARSLSSAQGALRETMAEVVSSAQTVAAAAEELSAANAQVAAGSQETSAQAGVVANAADEVNRSVQAVASGAEQMGASIKEISHNANEAARVAAH
ncbi:MAG: HAMP domain-containing protein, partial [Demequina sp.]|uniref:HAMP domain-containing protein n=1 Tax=Demequina sp. TaxID=2050685 RepID=UPI003A8481C2